MNSGTVGRAGKLSGEILGEEEYKSILEWNVVATVLIAQEIQGVHNHWQEDNQKNGSVRSHPLKVMLIRFLVVWHLCLPCVNQSSTNRTFTFPREPTGQFWTTSADCPPLEM